MHLTRRPAVSLAAAAVAAALLLAGCGGGDDGDSKGDKIEGADDAGQKSSPGPEKSESGSEKKEPDFRTSDIELPDDVKLVFDWDQPSDPEKAAALDGAADYMRALMHGTVKQDPKDPVLAKYVVPLQTAQEFAQTKIKMDVDKGYTVTGQERYYKSEVGDVTEQKLAEVSFCMDQSKFFSKKIKTGKVLRTKESASSYLRLTLVMQAPEKSQQPWKARTFEAEEKAVKQCKD
ncbi:hypothetical protein [Streptomyces sp. 891-h]|uniref:hypothetical protein n=1 Tax=unclassified Streptomyces TaxID=2593676 RepID=UPI001FAA26AB|nr:hypothetical protein [Streptomyces sp. 891-h]UNZ19119.1 hypothetical protein HC362_20775 [Streptomyces sp. 891-h]